MLVDSRSTNCFISEHLAAAAFRKMPLQQPVTVRVANGDMLLCTHELPDQLWCIQGVTFKTSFKILPLNCYDMILGMDWLVGNSPMEIHWAEKWFQFSNNGRTVKIFGLQTEAVMGPLLLCISYLPWRNMIQYCTMFS